MMNKELSNLAHHNSVRESSGRRGDVGRAQQMDRTSEGGKEREPTAEKWLASSSARAKGPCTYDVTL